MADEVEKVSEVTDRDTAGNRVTTRAVSHDSRDQKVSKAAQVVWFITGIVLALLAIRVVLALLGANLANGFASFIYALSDPFVAPFRGLLQVGEFHAGVSRFELETIVAMVVYALLGWGIAAAIRLASKNDARV
jgi:uncharacterized protein YggT (Ycf19 family)